MENPVQTPQGDTPGALCQLCRSRPRAMELGGRYGDGLDLQKLGESGDAHLPTDAGLLVSTEGSIRGEPSSAVNADGAGPDPFRNGERPVIFAPVDRPRKTED